MRFVWRRECHYFIIFCWLFVNFRLFVISCTAKTFFKLLFHSFQKLKMFYLFHGIKFSWCYLVSCSCYLSFPIFLYSFKIYRVNSSHPHVFSKNDVLRNFGKFTGKHLCQSLFFFWFAGLSPTTLLRKRLWH